MLSGRIFHIARLSRQPLLFNSAKLASNLPKYAELETLQVTKTSDFVLKVELNRPEKRNAMNNKMWKEIGSCFRTIADDPDCRCVILSGSGKMFSAGIDLADFRALFEGIVEEPDVGRRALKIRKFVSGYQDDLSAIEKCRKPVIGAIHGHCIGAGINMAAAVDIRYCTADALFNVKEVELGLAADVGALQRMGKATGNSSLLREYVFLSKDFGSAIALQMGFVSRVLPDASTLMHAVEALAASIASKSPIAVQGSKETLNFSRDHSVADGLDYVATWNMAMLQSEDVPTSMLAMMQKSKPEFGKL